jgi:hypothetical protein
VKNKLIRLNEKGVNMIDLKFLQQCGVWGYDAVPLGEQFPTFRFTVLP